LSLCPAHHLGRGPGLNPASTAASFRRYESTVEDDPSPQHVTPLDAQLPDRHASGILADAGCHAGRQWLAEGFLHADGPGDVAVAKGSVSWPGTGVVSQGLSVSRAAVVMRLSPVPCDPSLGHRHGGLATSLPKPSLLRRPAPPGDGSVEGDHSVSMGPRIRMTCGRALDLEIRSETPRDDPLSAGEELGNDRLGASHPGQFADHLDVDRFRGSSQDRLRRGPRAGGAGVPVPEFVPWAAANDAPNHFPAAALTIATGK
jgi:hypothetical protein